MQKFNPQEREKSTQRVTHEELLYQEFTENTQLDPIQGKTIKLENPNRITTVQRNPRQEGTT